MGLRPTAAIGVAVLSFLFLVPRGEGLNRALVTLAAALLVAAPGFLFAGDHEYATGKVSGLLTVLLPLLLVLLVLVMVMMCVVAVVVGVVGVVAVAVAAAAVAVVLLLLLILVEQKERKDVDDDKTTSDGWRKRM